MPLQTGDKAPDVTLPSHDNQQVSLASLWSEGQVVLLFFPLAFTGVCTKEMCTMRDDMAIYDDLKARVVGVSVDSPYVLKRFREDIGAEYLFLSDFNREASRAFGVLRSAPVGPGLMDVSERAVFVIGTDGTVKWMWQGEHPGLLPPFDEIKRALAEPVAA